MRIVVHDFGGYAFPVQLSRGLAARGHEVLHLYCAAVVETPHGELVRRADDPPGFVVEGLVLSSPIQKYNFFQRFAREHEYSARLVERCRAFEPDVVLSANAPSLVQHRLLRALQRQNIPLVSWVQDLYGLAAYRILSKRLPLLGHLVGRYFLWLDRQWLSGSAAVVYITEDFAPLVRGLGASVRQAYTIPNWAPLEDLPERPRENTWSQAQELGKGVRFVYSGTLGMKHNPALLLRLGSLLAQRGDGELVVISRGAGVNWIKEQLQRRHVRAAIRFLDFQPFEAVPEMLSSADVLVAVLQADAGTFSVPSKVLSYLCAGRAVLAAIPGQNLAARIVQSSAAGLTVDPEQSDNFLAAALELCENRDLRSSCGRNARRYAEEHFELAPICDQFEGILERVAERDGTRVTAEID